MFKNRVLHKVFSLLLVNHLNIDRKLGIFQILLLATFANLVGLDLILLLQVYGMPLKAVIHEKFGDDIMSAIDFTLDVEEEESSKGDRENSPSEARVKVIMSGKFLPYKKW